MSRQILLVVACGLAAAGTALAVFQPWRDELPTEQPVAAIQPKPIHPTRVQPESQPKPGAEIPAKVIRKGLTEYHEKVARIFAMTPGFGRGRMPIVLRRVENDVVYLSPGEIEQDIELVKNAELIKADKGFKDYFASKKAGRVLDSRLTGYVRLVQDQQAEIPSGITQNAKTTKKKTPAKLWRMEAIELVGLIEPDNPVVYDSAKVMGFTFHKNANPAAKNRKNGAEVRQKTGPRLPKNARVPDYFELAGIDHLEQGNDLFAYRKDNNIRMLGALRLTRQCAGCHDNMKEGDLIGALSYTLRRQK